jgi:hypothetical protein
MPSLAEIIFIRVDANKKNHVNNKCRRDLFPDPDWLRVCSASQV